MSINAEQFVMSDLVERLEAAHRDSTQRCNGSDIFLEAASEIKKLRFELLMVAKAAADEPMYFYPLNAALAKRIRDRVLDDAGKYAGS